jgi:hypothetical protein
MRIFLTTFLAKTCFVIAYISIALTFTSNPVYGQIERLANETNSSEITISMKRDGLNCFYFPANEKDLGGNCPVYSIVIANDGTVTYEGVRSVKVRGNRTFTIPTEQVKQLIADFERIKFFELQDKYAEKRLPDGSVRTIDHSNGTTITLKVGNRTKSVYNFYGASEELDALQKKLDDIRKQIQR